MVVTRRKEEKEENDERAKEGTQRDREVGRNQRSGRILRKPE